MSTLYKETVIAPLRMETAAFAKAASALSIPPEDARQPDLQYLAAIFVSSGMNKNGAVFLGSELIKARDTISLKAVDIEHDEISIVGHILENAYLYRDGSVLNAEVASQEMSISEMDSLELDIAVSAVLHKTRFPELCEEVRAGEWMVSMESYYRDYDIKVGDLIIPKDEAMALGYDKMVGSVVQVKDGTKELGFHLVGRVLRDILFSGVGLVKNPANDRSIIYEAAAINEFVQTSVSGSEGTVNLVDVRELGMAGTNNISQMNKDSLGEIVSSLREAIEDGFEKIKTSLKPDKQVEEAKTNYPGTCVSYKKYLYEAQTADDDTLPAPPTNTSQYPMSVPSGGAGDVGPSDKIIAEHWCSLFERECSSRPGDASHPDCWRNVLNRVVIEEVTSYEDVLLNRQLEKSMVKLSKVLESASKYTKK